VRNDQVVGWVIGLPFPNVGVEGANAGCVRACPVNERLKHGWTGIDGVNLDGGVFAEQASSEAAIAISQSECATRGAAFVQERASAKHKPRTEAQ